MKRAHMVLRITLVLLLTLVVTAGLHRQAEAQSGQPIISMNASRYCVGGSYQFTLRNGLPNTPIRLFGTRGGQFWEIPGWARTDADGNFSSGGTYEEDALGDFTLTVDVGGTVSNILSVAVSDCRIATDSAHYCVGDSWKFTLRKGVPNTAVRLFGTRDGQFWEIRDWGRTDADGNISAEGTHAADALGKYTLTVDMGGTLSNTISITVSDCRIAMDSAEYCLGDPWKFTLSKGVPNTFVRLLGTSNGQSWEIPDWVRTDADGNVSQEGLIAADAPLGTHTRKLDMGRTMSNTVSFVVYDCRLSGRIAFVSTRDGEGPPAGHLAVPYIYIANTDGSGSKKLTRGASPSWSRDGQRIAFHSWIGGSINSGGPEIRVINADGSNERVLGPGSYPSWSPDGTKIVFMGFSDPDYGIFMGMSLRHQGGAFASVDTTTKRNHPDSVSNRSWTG